MSKVNLKHFVLEKGVHYLTAGFPYYSDGTRHWGNDYYDNPDATKRKDYVVAPFPGVIVSLQKNITVTIKSTGTEGMGNYVIIDHPEFYGNPRSRFMHMKYKSVIGSVGDYKDEGFRIGIIGTTGNSTGIHIHYDLSFPMNTPGDGINHGGRYYVNPSEYLNADIKTVKEALNVRTGAGTAYKVVDEIPGGKKVFVLERQGSWARIGKNKWVSANYLY